MRAWLAWTSLGELTSMVMFSILVWMYTQGSVSVWPFTLFGLLLLDLVLLQGAIYWLIKRRREAWRQSARSRLILIRALYVANALALGAFPVAVVMTGVVTPWALRTADLLAGLALFLFACGEFVHYFLFKINMRPRELQIARARGRPIEARIWRELRRARAEAEAERGRHAA